MASIDEIKNNNFIDTTAGKVTEPYENKTPIQTDSHFMPSSETDTEGVLSNNDIKPKRIPVLDAPDPDEPEEFKQPTISVKSGTGGFDPNQELEPFDINSLPKRQVEEKPDEMETRLMDNLDAAVGREKESITERTNNLIEAQRKEAEILYEKGFITKKDEEEVDKDIEGYEADRQPDTVQINTNPPTEEIINDEKDLFEDDEETLVETVKPKANELDLDELEADLAKEVGEPDETREEAVSRIANEVRQRTNPIKNKIDLNSFEVSEVPAVINIEDHMSLSNISTADWVRPNDNRISTYSALSGPELLAMNPARSSQNRVNTMRAIYYIIYKHIVSEKPATFEEWLNTTPFNDLDHHYFGLFKATFSGSNFMNYECSKCGHNFIKDLEFDDYVVYKDDESKKKVEDLMRVGDTSLVNHDVIRSQIDDNYVMDLRNPSIQNTVIDVAGLSSQFVEKYSDLMDILVYIDNVYKINYQTHKLDPIDMKPAKDNQVKTTARRISILSRILNKDLSTDAYYELRRNIIKSYPNLDVISYQIPGCKCEKCGHDIPAVTRDIEAQTLLFMRHQLGAFVML